MKKFPTLFGVSMLISLAALVALATSDADKPDSAAEPDLSPLTQQIHAVLEAEHSALAELQGRLAAAPDEQAYLLVVREIEQRKLASEMRVLELQLAQARQQDRLDEVRAINAALEALRSVAAEQTAPSPPPAPASPPAQN